MRSLKSFYSRRRFMVTDQARREPLPRETRREIKHVHDREIVNCVWRITQEAAVIDRVWWPRHREPRLFDTPARGLSCGKQR